MSSFVPRLLLLALLLIGALSGCGNKGALYRPGDVAAATDAPATASEEAEDDDGEGEGEGEGEGDHRSP